MNLSTIEQGKKLDEAGTPAPWFDDRTKKAIKPTHESLAFTRGDFDIFRYPTRTNKSLLSHEEWDANAELVCFLRNHASELLQMAREMEGLKERLQAYENVEAVQAINSAFITGKTLL
jgi:hypothetical protein